MKLIFRDDFHQAGDLIIGELITIMLIFTVTPIPKNKPSSVNYEVRHTYIVLPDNLVGPGVSMHFALKIYVITFFNIVRVEVLTQV